MRDGRVVADAERAKIAVVERHHATGRVGLGLVRGFGLQSGGFASTVAHDAHNLVVVGVTDADMAVCVQRLQEIGGGIVVSRDGAVRGELAKELARQRVPHELVTVPDAEHGLAGGDKKLVAEAHRRALDFIRKHLAAEKR